MLFTRKDRLGPWDPLEKYCHRWVEDNKFNFITNSSSNTYKKFNAFDAFCLVNAFCLVK